MEYYNQYQNNDGRYYGYNYYDESYYETHDGSELGFWEWFEMAGNSYNTPYKFTNCKYNTYFVIIFICFVLYLIAQRK